MILLAVAYIRSTVSVNNIGVYDVPECHFVLTLILPFPPSSLTCIWLFYISKLANIVFYF